MHSECTYSKKTFYIYILKPGLKTFTVIKIYLADVSFIISYNGCLLLRKTRRKENYNEKSNFPEQLWRGVNF